MSELINVIPQAELETKLPVDVKSEVVSQFGAKTLEECKAIGFEQNDRGFFAKMHERFFGDNEDLRAVIMLSAKQRIHLGWIVAEGALTSIGLTVSEDVVDAISTLFPGVGEALALADDAAEYLIAHEANNFFEKRAEKQQLPHNKASTVTNLVFAVVNLNPFFKLIPFSFVNLAPVVFGKVKVHGKTVENYDTKNHLAPRIALEAA